MTAPHVCAFASRYTGKERDTESGLDYFGARYYASSMGRFMSPDNSEGPDTVPYALWSDPQTLNLYSYVRNNPLRSIDPDGHASYQPCNGGTQQCFQGDYNGEIYCQTCSGCIQWNGKTGEWDAYHAPLPANADGRMNPDNTILEWIVGGKVADAAIGTIGGLFGRGAAKVGEGVAAKERKKRPLASSLNNLLGQRPRAALLTGSRIYLTRECNCRRLTLTPSLPKRSS